MPYFFLTFAGSDGAYSLEDSVIAEKILAEEKATVVQPHYIEGLDATCRVAGKLADHFQRPFNVHLDDEAGTWRTTVHPRPHIPSNPVRARRR